jgi:hypothetical protein
VTERAVSVTHASPLHGPLGRGQSQDKELLKAQETRPPTAALGGTLLGGTASCPRTKASPPFCGPHHLCAPCSRPPSNGQLAFHFLAVANDAAWWFTYGFCVDLCPVSER